MRRASALAPSATGGWPRDPQRRRRKQQPAAGRSSANRAESAGRGRRAGRNPRKATDRFRELGGRGCGVGGGEGGGAARGSGRRGGGEWLGV
jgi:hypothetical protein